MKYFLILIGTFLLFWASGYEYQELNDLGIVSSIGISYQEKMFEVSIAIVPSDNSHDEFMIYKSKGRSIQEAFRYVKEKYSKQLHVSHMEVLIIDPTVFTSSHVADIFDFFLRKQKFREDFLVYTGSVDEVMSVIRSYHVSLKDISKMNQYYLGYTTLIRFQDLLSLYFNPYQEMVIPSIEVVSALDGDKNFVVSGIYLFHGTQLVGLLREDDVLVYHLMKKDAKKFLLRIHEEKDKFLVYEINYKDTKIHFDLEKSRIVISLLGDAYLMENTTYYEVLEDSLNKELENKVLSSIKNTFLKYHTDIYSLKDIFYKRYPHALKKQQDTWINVLLNDFEFDIQSNIKIKKKNILTGGGYE